MRAYSATGPSATGTATKTAVSLVGGTTVRPCVYDITFSSTTAAADNTINARVSRWTTSAGTAGSTPVATVLDPADVAAVTTVGITHSGEPTYASTFLYDIAFNQRATFRWVANPGFEFKNPATATTGIGVYLQAATSSAILQSTVQFFE